MPVRAEGDLDFFSGTIDPTDPSTIYINTRSDNPAAAVFGHELNHQIDRVLGKDHAAVVALHEAQRASMPDLGYFMDRFAQAEGLEWKRLAPKEQERLTDKALQENTGDILGENIVRPEFWQKLEQADPSIFQRTAKIVIDLIDRVKGWFRVNKNYSGEQYLKRSELENIRNLLATKVAAYRRGGAMPEGIRPEPPKPAEPVESTEGAIEKKYRQRKRPSGFGNMHGVTPFTRIAQLGGIRDARGDLFAALDGKPGLKKRVLRPNNEDGLTIDYIGKMLAERGYLPNDYRERDVIDWLDENGHTPMRTDKGEFDAGRRAEEEMTASYERQAEREAEALTPEERAALEVEPEPTGEELPFQRKREEDLFEQRQAEIGKQPPNVQQRELFKPSPEQTSFATPSAEAKAGKAEPDVEGQQTLFQRRRNAAGEPMRRFNERVIDEPRFAADAPAIEANPQSFYEPQSLSDIGRDLSVRSDADLLNILHTKKTELTAQVQNDNNAVMAGIELINRRLASNQSIEDVVINLGETGTAVGQLLRQFAELKTSTPQGILAAYEALLKKEKRFLTPNQRTKMMALAQADLTARASLRQMEAQYRNTPTPALAAQLDQAARDSETKSRNLLVLGRALMPKHAAAMLGQMIQGNLLTPMSQAANVIGNLSFAPARFPAKSIAAMSDLLISAVTGKPRTVLQPLGETVTYGKGLAKGGAKALRNLPTGVDPSGDLLDVGRGFQPVRAWVQALGKEELPVTVSGKIPLGDRGKKIMEGTLGVAPEIMFRGLGFGDQFFKGGAYESALHEIGRLKGLKGDALADFMRAPDTKSGQQAVEQALEAVFQNKNKAVTGINFLVSELKKVPWVGEYIDALLVKPVTPYVSTPLNIAWESAQYLIPPLSASQMLYHSVQGNRRAALLAFGRFATGVTILTVAQTLANLGLVSADPDKQDEKLRAMQYGGFKPNSLNLTGLKRWMDGGDTTFQPGDQIIQYQRMGIIGAAMQLAANQRLEKIKRGAKEGEKPEALTIIGALASSPMKLGAAMLQQTFLKGQLTLLQAVYENKWDGWYRQYIEAVSSIALPNTVKAIGNAQQEFIPEMRAKETETGLKNVLKTKVGMTEDIPLKIDSFGKPILRTPEGRNAWLYNLVDVFKAQKTPENKLYTVSRMVWENTLDNRALPSPPQRNIIGRAGTKIQLNDQQYETYSRYVGEARAKLMEPLLEDIRKAPPEKQIDLLSRIYERGTMLGKARFIRESNLPATGRYPQQRERLARISGAAAQ